MENLKRGGAFALAMAALASGGAAEASCWTPVQVRAAQVRDLETMLMVSALRCRKSPEDFMARYNAFVVHSRGALTEVNAQLRAHFSQSVGAAQALNAYDNYVTRIANRYGAGAEGLGCSDMGSIVDAAMHQGGSFDTLAALAARASVEPMLDAPACSVRVATLTH